MSSASTSAALYAVVSSPKRALKAVPKNLDQLSHHNKNGKGFINPWDSYIERGPMELGQMMLKRYMAGKFKSPDTTPPHVTVRKPEFLPTRETSQLRATWLGHACYFVEFPGGLRVLFDPVFEERCSPFSFMGPKRYTPAPCHIEDIPFIDAVVISHSHYDHLSHPTITKIQQKFPNAHFFAPLGNKEWFTKCGIDNMTELDWWESKDFTLSARYQDEKTAHQETKNSVKAGGAEDIQAVIGCLPAQHTSARTPFDKSHTLWGSWSVQSGDKKVWFGGDTGYRSVPELPETEFDYDDKYDYPHCPAFKEIGDLRGPFDLGLIPIGAYDPRYIMSPMHADPYDSVNIFIDSKCKRAMGIHWGTWVLTEEDVMAPKHVLKQALKWKNLPEEGVFDTCDIGESREFV